LVRNEICPHGKHKTSTTLAFDISRLAHAKKMGKKKKVIMYCVLFTHSFINCRHFWPEGLKSFLIIYKAKAARLRFVPASVFFIFPSLWHSKHFPLLRPKIFNKT